MIPISAAAWAVAIGLLVASGSTSTAAAQPPRTQVAGTVQSMDADSVTLTSGATFTVTDQTRVTILLPVTAADLAVGQFVAITARRGHDGTLEASIVSRFPEGSTVPPGQRPMDETNIMTNATITEAPLAAVDEGRLTVAFGNETEEVQITTATRIEVQRPGSLADLAPGVAITAFLDPSGVAAQLRVHL